MQKHAIMAKISCINEKKSIFEWCNGNDQMNAEYNNICGMPNGFAKWCVGKQGPLPRLLLTVSTEVIRIYGHENRRQTILICKTVFSAQNHSISGVRAAGDDSSMKLFRSSCGFLCLFDGATIILMDRAVHPALLNVNNAV